MFNSTVQLQLNASYQNYCFFFRPPSDSGVNLISYHLEWVFHVLFCIAQAVAIMLLLSLNAAMVEVKSELIVPAILNLFCGFCLGVISSSSWCLGKAASFDCGFPWAFHLTLAD